MEGLPQSSDIEKIEKNYSKLLNLVGTLKHNITQTALNIEAEDEQYEFAEIAATRSGVAAPPQTVKEIESFLKHTKMLSHPQQRDLDVITKGSKLREYRQKVWNVTHPGEQFNDGGAGDNEDIFIASQTVNIMCPLTKKPFEEPVKSTACGHVFSKGAIGDLFRQNRAPQMRCPVVGCQKTFTNSNLERDVEMEETVKRELRRTPPLPAVEAPKPTRVQLYDGLAMKQALDDALVKDIQISTSLPRFDPNYTVRVSINKKDFKPTVLLINHYFDANGDLLESIFNKDLKKLYRSTQKSE
eukprot:gene6106-7073_t